MWRHTLFAAVLSLALSACGDRSRTEAEGEAAATPPPATSAAGETGAASDTAHAPAGVVPGSSEDWCEEHQVPESLCSRCNPSLVAAFKATGDWCAEHGLPESQCRQCNPELKIERPPKQTGG